MDPVRQDGTPGCRFCFDPASPTDPRITPCRCTGSIKYIHLQCLKQWRRTTENPDFIRQCQLCLEHYNMPLKHPLENIPNIEHDQVWFLLSKPYIPIVLSNYIYIIMNQDTTKEKLLNAFDLIKISPETFPNILFFGMSTGIFACYLTYYINFLYHVKNKKLYAKYWLSFNLNNTCPLPYASAILLSYIMIYLQIYPFGIFFILMLPKFMIIHTTILHSINIDAEL